MSDLGCTNLKVYILTVLPKTNFYEQYQYSHRENEIINKKVQDLLDAGIVRESMYGYGNHIKQIKFK